MKFYDLRNLEFLHDEVHSGVRSATDASDQVQVFRGQTDKYTLTEHATLGGVLSVTPRSDGRSLIKLTGGSQWLVLQTCRPNVGDELLNGYLQGGKMDIYNLTQQVECHSESEFVGSW
jgi:hypothetical protein